MNITECKVGDVIAVFGQNVPSGARLVLSLSSVDCTLLVSDLTVLVKKANYKSLESLEQARAELLTQFGQKIKETVTVMSNPVDANKLLNKVAAEGQ
jgi:hypothetical protein